MKALDFPGARRQARRAYVVRRTPRTSWVVALLPARWRRRCGPSPRVFVTVPCNPLGV